MKDRKRFLLIFAVFWIIGMVGGYFLGVGSAFLPAENVEYNYYYSEKAEGSDVEPIKKNCDGQASSTTDSENGFYRILKESGILNIPHKLVEKITK